MNKKINIAVIGATGYTGLDLVYLLSKHPRIRIINLCATKNLGKDITFFERVVVDCGFGSIDVCVLRFSYS